MALLFLLCYVAEQWQSIVFIKKKKEIICQFRSREHQNKPLTNIA